MGRMVSSLKVDLRRAVSSSVLNKIAHEGEERIVI